MRASSFFNHHTFHSLACQGGGVRGILSPCKRAWVMAIYCWHSIQFQGLLNHRSEPWTLSKSINFLEYVFYIKHYIHIFTYTTYLIQNHGNHSENLKNIFFLILWFLVLLLILQHFLDPSTVLQLYLIIGRTEYA